MRCERKTYTQLPRLLPAAACKLEIYENFSIVIARASALK
jgi:hypothetical protein